MADGNILSTLGAGFGRGLLALGTGGISELGFAGQRQQQQRAGQQSQEILNALAAQPGASPTIQSLAQIGTPAALKFAQTLQPAPITPFQQQQLGIQERGIEVKERKEKRLQQTSQRRQQLIRGLTDPQGFGGQTLDIAAAEGPKLQIQQLKQKNRQISVGLVDPEFKDFFKAQLEANNEEIKNLRTLEKEKRKLEEGLSPEQAAKAAMVQKGIKDIDKALSLFEEKGEGIGFFEALSTRGPVFGVGFQGVPFTTGRRARSLILGATNAQLRAESGAAVPESEVERAAVRFFPSPLDTKEARKEKLLSLREQLKGTLDLIKGPAMLREPLTQVQEQPVSVRTLSNEELLRIIQGQ